MSSAVVLSSGGINSATVLEIALRAHRPDTIHMLSFKYESKSNDQECLASLDLYHYYLDRNENITWDQIELPDLFNDKENTNILSFLNANMLLMAATYTTIKKVKYVYAGMCINTLPNFHASMGAIIYGASHHSVRLKLPLLLLTGADIVRRAYDLEVPINLTWSCHQPVLLLRPAGSRPERWVHCGVCLPCIDRINGFDKVSVVDPVPYAIEVEWYPMYKPWPFIGEKQLRAGQL